MISLIPENVVRNGQLKNSSVTVKKLGDAEQPCLSPRWRVKVSPVFKIDIITLRYIEEDRSESTRLSVVRLSATNAPLK